jgi:hypothetical protein
MTVALKPAVEEETYNMDFVDLYEELEALERRVMVQSFHIRQVKLEADREAYQPEEWLEGFGDTSTQEEMTKIKMSKKEDKQQLGDETAELNFTAEKQSNTVRGDKDSMGEGKIMILGNTFVTIMSPKFLAAIFWLKKCFFWPKSFSAENFHVKFNGALEIRVQCFLDELFSRGKHISAEIIFFRNVYF